MNSIVTKYFGEAHAASYDERAAKFAYVRDTLNALIRAVFAELPSESRILCVGAGTGAELLDLARTFPGWRFTAVEPSPAMLEICRKKAHDAGIASRCEFHEGFLDSLPETQPYDGATTILVSQFLVDTARRLDFFREVSKRLLSGGRLINADLASANQDFEGLFRVWLRAQGLPADEMKASQMGWGKDVAVSRPDEIELLIAGAGFELPTLFYQALFIHAWYAHRT